MQLSCERPTDKTRASSLVLRAYMHHERHPSRGLVCSRAHEDKDPSEGIRERTSWCNRSCPRGQVACRMLTRCCAAACGHSASRGDYLCHTGPQQETRCPPRSTHSRRMRVSLSLFLSVSVSLSLSSQPLKVEKLRTAPDDRSHKSSNGLCHNKIIKYHCFNPTPFLNPIKSPNLVSTKFSV